MGLIHRVGALLMATVTRAAVPPRPPKPSAPPFNWCEFGSCCSRDRVYYDVSLRMHLCFDHWESVKRPPVASVHPVHGSDGG
jgi:hypothetical protein